jgi:hypothetical protein
VGQPANRAVARGETRQRVSLNEMLISGMGVWALSRQLLVGWYQASVCVNLPDENLCCDSSMSGLPFTQAVWFC